MKLKTMKEMNFSSRTRVDFEIDSEVILVRFPHGLGARHFYFNNKKKAREKWEELQDKLTSVADVSVYPEMVEFFHVNYREWENFWFALEKIIGDLGNYKSQSAKPIVPDKDTFVSAIGTTEKKRGTQLQKPEKETAMVQPEPPVKTTEQRILDERLKILRQKKKRKGSKVNPETTETPESPETEPEIET